MVKISDKDKELIRYLCSRLYWDVLLSEESDRQGRDQWDFYYGHEAIRTFLYISDEIDKAGNKDLRKELQNILDIARARESRKEHKKLILNEMLDGVKDLVNKYKVDVKYATQEDLKKYLLWCKKNKERDK